MTEQGLKIILSRKGFDSASGGCASPIFPNGRFYSLPIPFAPGAQKRYADLGAGIGLEGSDMGTVVESLSAGRVHRSSFARLDPDLDVDAVPRLPGWRAAFGQVETAQVHLANQHIGVGDVFLFHGWFRAVHRDRTGRWWYQPGAPDINMIFGWLQVGEVIDLIQTRTKDVLERLPWLRDHPHLHFPADLGLRPAVNVIYVAAEKLHLPGIEGIKTPGAGVFRTYDSRLVLTAEGKGGRSVWKLPRWFKGDEQRPWLTQYPQPKWWTDDDKDGVLLQPVGRQGQEAVLECRNRPEAGPWIVSLFA